MSVAPSSAKLSCRPTPPPGRRQQMPAGMTSVVDAPRAVSSDASPTRPLCAVKRASMPGGFRSRRVFGHGCRTRWLGHRPGRLKPQLKQFGRDRLPVPELHIEAHGIARRVLNLHAPRGALAGRASMMLRENTVPAPTLAGEAACGSRLSRNRTSKGCSSRTVVASYSARACPLAPCGWQKIWSSSSGNPSMRSQARSKPLVAVTPVAVESTGSRAVPVRVRGMLRNTCIQLSDHL